MFRVVVLEKVFSPFFRFGQLPCGVKVSPQHDAATNMFLHHHGMCGVCVCEHTQHFYVGHKVDALFILLF